MIKTYCDRCGQEIQKNEGILVGVAEMVNNLAETIRGMKKGIPPRNRFVIVTKKHGLRSEIPAEAELCLSCKQAFREFMNYKPEQKPKDGKDVKVIIVDERKNKTK